MFLSLSRVASLIIYWFWVNIDRATVFVVVRRWATGAPFCIVVAGGPNHHSRATFCLFSAIFLSPLQFSLSFVICCCRRCPTRIPAPSLLLFRCSLSASCHCCCCSFVEFAATSFILIYWNSIDVVHLITLGRYNFECFDSYFINSNLIYIFIIVLIFISITEFVIELEKSDNEI